MYITKLVRERVLLLLCQISDRSTHEQQLSLQGDEVITHTHTHTTILLLVWNMSGYTRVSRYQKGKTKKVKTNLDLLE